MEYLKLGETASIFFDPTTKLLIRANEVVALSSLPKSKKIGLAKRSGHITSATKEEYEKFLATLPAEKAEKFKVTVSKTTKKKGKSEEDDYEYNPDLLKLTPDQFRERVEEEGFLDEDIAKFDGMTDIKAMIKLFDEINKEY